MRTEPPLRLGISTCLLGQKVRFDGGDKRDHFLTDVLGRYVEWVPVCPEVEMGMGVPREAVRLVGTSGAPRMVGVVSGTDHTAVMRRFAAARLRALAALDLSGYVFKEGSPSCGTARVPVLGRDGSASRGGRGLFAIAFMAAFPLLPVEEESRLQDVRRRENFVERIFCHRRWRTLVSGGVTRAALLEFHDAHEFVLLAHSPRHHRALGRLLGEHETMRPAALARRYGALFMEGLAVHATIKKHAAVLQRLTGVCRGHLGAAERRELAEVIDEYRHGLVPLVVPTTLLRHSVERHRVARAIGQVYLAPHPAELMLRNQLRDQTA